MTRVRFNTDRALFDAFPSARDYIKTEALGAPPQAFLRILMADRKLDEALSFCAYLLPRREAVAWGCHCLRQMDPNPTGPESPALRAAEAWVRTPDDEMRVAAYDLWTTGDKEEPAIWLALGAAWSGGSLQPAMANSMPAGPHLTANAVRVALLLRLHRLKLDQKSGCAEVWVTDGVRFAENGL